MSEQESIPYATPAPKDSYRIWAGVAIVMAGIGLIGLGGCFLIGVLAAIRPSVFGGPFSPSQPSLSSGDMVFVAVLSVLAACCFGGAICLLVAGVRGLLRILNHR